MSSSALKPVAQKLQRSVPNATITKPGASQDGKNQGKKVAPNVNSVSAATPRKAALTPEQASKVRPVVDIMSKTMAYKDNVGDAQKKKAEFEEQLEKSAIKTYYKAGTFTVDIENKTVFLDKYVQVDCRMKGCRKPPPEQIRLHEDFLPHCRTAEDVIPLAIIGILYYAATHFRKHIQAAEKAGKGSAEEVVALHRRDSNLRKVMADMNSVLQPQLNRKDLGGLDTPLKAVPRVSLEVETRGGKSMRKALKEKLKLGGETASDKKGTGTAASTASNSNNTTISRRSQ